MLQISIIEKEFDRCVEGLKKRGIENAKDLLNQVIAKDSKRKQTQQELDSILQKSNQLVLLQ